MIRLKPISLAVLVSLVCFGILARYVTAQTPATASKDLAPSFDQVPKPFFKQYCVRCHNTDMSVAGVRVDQLNADMEDRHIATWESIRRRVQGGSMPPKGLPQPTPEERQKVTAWITDALEVARMRPAPKNGLVRRLTVAQYRNTLRELLQIDDDLTAGLPPDAISRDGFVNNKDTLQLSPLLTEAYFQIAEDALNRAIVDPGVKPRIQDFRVDLGKGVNPAPLAEKLVLGADSMLLDNPDVLVTQPTLTKPFPFDPICMRTKYRYIEGYRGNDTVRGWRDFDSIYHAVFADMRGSRGYPKGHPYETVPAGLLLRPAIPTEEMFDADGTYGPKANFKISVRELPDSGRFRVTVTAAKYRDGLLLDAGAKPASAADAVTVQHLEKAQTVAIRKAGVYQVDVYAEKTEVPTAADATHLAEGLTGPWPRDGEYAGKLEGKAKLGVSPLGKALSLQSGGDMLRVARKLLPTNDAMNVGEGDFSVSAWIHPDELKRTNIVSLGNTARTLGWYLELADNRGTLRFETAGRDDQADAKVSTSGGVIQAKTWQHVAVVVRRGRNETRLYVNGHLVGRATTGTAQFDDTAADLEIGKGFAGQIADVRLYRRPLEQTELLALVQPGKELAKPPVENPDDLRLSLGDREFSGALKQPAFVVLRLEAGQLPLTLQKTGFRTVDRVVLTPLPAGDDGLKRFLAFEKRSPRVGVHLGLRRDCGSTLARVGQPQTVSSEKLSKFVFEGAIKNYPSPEVEKDNVNYLAGVREIGVRSEYTDGRDMPRMVVRSVEFEGPYYDQWPPESHRNIFVDFDRKNDQPAYAKHIIHSFATRAYRRPVTASEEAMLLSVYGKSMASGQSFQQSIKDALLVALTSPQFLFLIETSATPEPEPLDSYELASKLSYFLWNGPPDQHTLQLAASGGLGKHLEPEVSRMIADPKFARFTSEFVAQWLSLDKFSVLEPDRKRYPKLTTSARVQLRQEPIEYVQYLIRNNLPVKDLISSDFMVANEAVANYYDLADKTESGFRFIAFPHGRRELGGVLTEAAVMSGLSDGRESNPVKRGAWLARKIIAEPPPDPPPNVPPLKEDTKNLTLRQRLEQHRNVPGCLQCHTKIDPWGVAMEEFDAGGRLKKQAADAHSVLPDKTEVSGANDLKRYLAEDRIDQVAFSVLRHLSTYATGRTLTYSEQAFLKKDQLRLKANGYRMQDLVKYVVNSKVFLEK